LAKLTDFKIFHNHLTIDLLSTILKWGTKSFFDLSKKFRAELFEAAAKEKIDGIIFTVCYSHPDDDKFVKDVKRRVEKYEGEVLFVQLYCEKSELKKRVKDISRKKYGKITTIKSLEKGFEKWDFLTPIPFVKSFRIDNTKLSPRKVAKLIQEQYKL
jgi:hypothetical protein